MGVNIPPRLSLLISKGWYQTKYEESETSLVNESEIKSCNLQTLQRAPSPTQPPPPAQFPANEARNDWDKPSLMNKIHFAPVEIDQIPTAPEESPGGIGAARHRWHPDPPGFTNRGPPELSFGLFVGSSSTGQHGREFIPPLFL